ncbi:MAG: phage holin family protein, partial [Pseudomonadales bacterium]|nr:phage holin family protein [Pseudomonadales bacterium]
SYKTGTNSVYNLPRPAEKHPMMDLILHIALLAGVIFALARSLSGIYVGGYGTALLVAIVYGLINVTLGTLLKILSIPFIIVTVGVFLLFINTFLLWLTDQLLDDFEIDDLGTTFLAAALITLADTLLSWAL